MQILVRFGCALTVTSLTLALWLASGCDEKPGVEREAGQADAQSDGAPGDRGPNPRDGQTPGDTTSADDATKGPPDGATSGDLAPDGAGSGSDASGPVASIVQPCDQKCPQSAACTDTGRDGLQLTCHDKVAQAFGAVVAGGRIIIRAGTWREGAFLRKGKDGVEIVAANGGRLEGVAVGGKGALVIQSNDVVVRNLECSKISVPDENGACIRAEGTNLTLDRVYFHDSEQGLLGGKGEVRVIDSTFERLGLKGQAHGIYASSAVTLMLIRRSRFLSSKDQGHEVKSRAVKTVIEDSTIAALSGVDSRSIDIPNGGEVVLRGNVIHQGPNSANSDAIGVGQEGVKHTNNSVTMENNWIINDRARGVRWLALKGMPQPTLRCNRTVGGTDPAWGGDNQHFADRAAAKIGAFPALPDPPTGGCK